MPKYIQELAENIYDFEEHCSLIYGLDYFEKMLLINSSTAKWVNDIRWEWVSNILYHIHDRPQLVLDYGSGCGFFRAYRPKGVIVDTHDVGLYPQTGIQHEEYDLITFWDVLEHISILEVVEAILERTKWVACTVPILPHNIFLHEWKHYKPGEHVRYYTEDVLNSFFKDNGFRLVKSGQPECPPREDVYSFLFQRTS